MASSIRDLLTILFNYQRNIRRRNYYRYTTILGRCQAFFAGADLEKGVQYFRKPFIQKYRTVKLSIGNYCTFRSDPTSNLIGINRPCILTVNPKAELTIGDRCGFSGTVIGCFDKVVLENGVRCG